MGKLLRVNGQPLTSELPSRNTSRSFDTEERTIQAFRPTSPSRRVDVPLPEPPNTEGLFPYQAEGARWLRTRYHALLADEMGLGKTVQVLRALPRQACALVVCPASLRLVWRDECSKFRPDLRPTVAGPGEFLVPKHGELVIVSYDSLPSPKSGARGWLVPDPALGLCTLILDEAHYTKNFRAERTRKVRLLGAQCEKTWALTGTPLLGTPMDLWGVLSSAGLSFEAFGKWENFLKLFGAKKNKWGGTEFAEDVENGEEIRERLSKVILRRLKKDVMPQLPRKMYATRTIETSEEILADLEVIDGAWTDKSELPPFELLSRVRSALAASRVPAMLELVEAYESEGKPLVVFSAHRFPVEALGGRPGWGVITGDTHQEFRRTIIDAFQTGALHGIALTIGAGALGITLTRAEHALFVDLSYTPAENAQAEDRLVRIGSTAESVLITRMVADHAVDVRLTEILDEKQRLIDATVGGAFAQKEIEL